MITRKQFDAARDKAGEMIRKAGIAAKDHEMAAIDVADFGLSQLEKEGAQILTFFCTERVSAKVIALLPNQTEPEHWHPPVKNDPGKEETIRVVSGTVFFYVPGNDTVAQGKIPDGKEACYTVRNERVMHAGDQITLAPGVKHWFQAGSEGAVMFTFATCARDVLDGFTDPAIERVTKIEE